MDLFTIVVAIIVWGFVVKLIIKTEPKSDDGFFKKVLWLLFWFFTLSFLFSSISSSANTTPNYYGGGGYDEDDDDSCEDNDYSFWHDEETNSWDDCDYDDDGD